ncbi:MAG: alpha/beta hydrolase [Chloroflexota bacterium]|nr:alpha/beta hydrolase [Chloroflexota bacterium]
MKNEHNSDPTVDLFYSESGVGQPLVLLHGLGGTGNDWELQLPAFAPRYRSLSVDLRGHGRSPKPKGPYHITQFAGDVVKLLKNVDAYPAHVLGLSLGGAVAQQLAIDYPDAVRSLVLVNTLPRFVSSQWRYRLMGARRFANLYFQGMDKVAEDVAERLFPMLEQAPLRTEAISRLATNDMSAYRASIWAVARFDVTLLLDLIDCPALVVAGDRDITIPLEPKVALADSLPNAKFTMVYDSGHATPIDQPEVFNQAVLDFLESTGAGG